MATATVALSCVGEDADRIESAHGAVLALLEDTDAGEVAWTLAGWLAEVLATVEPDDPGALLRLLGARIAAERS